MKIYTDEEMELINNVFDLIALKFGSKEFSDLVREIKELIKENQKYAREIERLNNIIKRLEEYTDEDDWTSVNGEIAVRLIKLKLQELKGDGSNDN